MTTLDMQLDAPVRVRRGGRRKPRPAWLAIVLADPHCFYCREPLVFQRTDEAGRVHRQLAAKATVDHVVPKSRGGTDDAANLVPCCRGCNESKGARPIETYVADAIDAMRRWRKRELPHLQPGGSDE